MNATTGVTNIGPRIGRYCNGVSSDVCGMATTAGGASAAASVFACTGPASPDVVTGSATLLRVGVLPNSWRAAAIIINGNGDSTGAVGELPADGFCTALTRLDTARVAGCASFGFSTVTDTVGAGFSATLGSSAVLVDGV